MPLTYGGSGPPRRGRLGGAYSQRHKCLTSDFICFKIVLVILMYLYREVLPRFSRFQLWYQPKFKWTNKSLFSHLCPRLYLVMRLGQARWLYIGGVTSGVTHRENGRRFMTPLVCAGSLLTGWKAACSGKSGEVRLRSALAKAASHPVSEQPAQISGVRKRLPFSMGVVPSLYSHLVVKIH